MTVPLWFSVGRDLGTVVVTVDGELDPAGSDQLELVLADLIEDQGNLAVTVDLHGATVRPEALPGFVAATRRAGGHSARLVVRDAPGNAGRALRSGGLGAFLA